MEGIKKNILCIDDHDDTCELVEFFFRELEYEVSSCNTSEEGLKHARQGGFGAIILDNRFDDADGIKVCKEIRNFDKNTPIVFFSGEVRTQEIEKALEAGANAYLKKDCL